MDKPGIPYPLQSLWNERKCASQKSKAELLGLVKGILADGMVVAEEAEFLRDWIESNVAMRSEWPGNVLFDRLQVMLEDRILDSEEQRELLARLCDFVDVRTRAAQQCAPPQRVATGTKAVTVHSPFDDPCPEIEHAGRLFVVTGDFACLPRKQVVREIEMRGGLVNNSVSRKVHFLIVGSLGSELWSQGSYGTKIEGAIQLRETGAGLRIVPEKHWYDTISNSV